MRTLLDAAVAGADLITKFQPIVSLPTETHVGFEALSRWPALGNLDPTAVFTHADSVGKRDTLDHHCVHSAAVGALQQVPCPGMLLFINIEPATSYSDLASDAQLAQAASTYHVVFELTERGLLQNPRKLMRNVAAIRSLGSAIALDDVGINDASLAVLDIVEPDIIKLDMALVQRNPSRTQARTIAAVLGHQERTGAIILAEGIETDKHLEQALTYGATLGQGFRFGEPDDLDAHPLPSAWPDFAHHPAHTGATSVFDLVSHGLTTHVVRKKTLLELSRHLERLAASSEIPPILLATLQGERPLYKKTKLRYRTLAKKSPLVAVFGRDIPEDLDPRVRRIPLQSSEQLNKEWAVVILGPDIAAALVGQEYGMRRPGHPEADGLFTVALTFDRNRVTLATRMMLSKAC